MRSAPRTSLDPPRELPLQRRAPCSNRPARVGAAARAVGRPSSASSRGLPGRVKVGGELLPRSSTSSRGRRLVRRAAAASRRPSVKASVQAPTRVQARTRMQTRARADRMRASQEKRGRCMTTPLDGPPSWDSLILSTPRHRTLRSTYTRYNPRRVPNPPPTPPANPQPDWTPATPTDPSWQRPPPFPPHPAPARPEELLLRGRSRRPDLSATAAAEEPGRGGSGTRVSPRRPIAARSQPELDVDAGDWVVSHPHRRGVLCEPSLRRR